MTTGRLKYIISCSVFLLIINIACIIALGQVASEIGDDTNPNTAISTRPARIPKSGIDSIMSSGSAEGYERVWQLTGPFGGDVTAMAVHPSNADTILLGTSDGQLYRSRDGGLIWRRVRSEIMANGFSVTSIRFDRENSNVIYVGVKAVTALGERTKGGAIFISEDGGETWQEIEGMHSRAVRGLSQSVLNPNILVAAALDGIYRTQNRGKTWERITPVNDIELRGFHSVAIDPRDEKIIYVGTNHLPWKTLDGGQTWNRAGSKETGMLDDSDIFAIHIDESDPDTVLMSACSGIYRSNDASSKWAKIQGIPYTSRRTHIIYQHPTRPDVIFAGTTEGLWLSTDHGKPESWRLVTSQRLVINAVAIHPDKPDRVFLGTEDNGVLISNDSGESYQSSNAGFINRQVRTVLADRNENGRVYAGVIFDSSQGGLFISEDGGLTWQQSMSGMGVRDVYSLYQSGSSPQTLYAGTNHGIFRSDNYGIDWSYVRKEEKIEAVKKGSKANSKPTPPRKKKTTTRSKNDSSRPRRAIENLTGYTFMPASFAPQKKRRTPARKSTTQSQKNVKPVPVVNDDLVDLKNQVFSITPFTTIPEIPEASESEAQVSKTWLLALTWDGLYYSSDEKKGWKKIRLTPDNEQRQPRINSLTTTPLAPGKIFAATDDGLFISSDNGKTFRSIQLSEEHHRVRIVVIDPRSTDRIYAGTTTGFFRSTDGGETWENRGGGMPLLTDVSAIEINSLNPDEIYVGDEMRGHFFYSRDRGINWVRLDMNLLPSRKISSLSSDPFNNNKLYIGSFSGGVYVLTRRPGR